jgi:predicted MFS family arabinose efflux permease
MATISYWQVLRLPQVSELLTCACLARLAGRMFDLTIILYSLRQFGSPALTGWVAFAAFGPGLIASPFAGALLDRLRAPLAIIVDMLINAGLLLALIFIDHAGQLGPASLIVLVTMCSLTSPLSASGIRVLIPRLVPGDGLERANALDTGSYALIEVVGPALAGGLFGFAGSAATMMVIVILYSLAAVSLVPILRAARTPTARRPTTLIGDAVAGLAHVARHPTLRGLAIAYSIYQMSWGVLLVVVPVAVIRALGPTANADLMVGALWAACGLAGGLGALLAGQVRSIGRERQMIGFSIAAMAVAIYPIASSLGLYGLAAGIIIMGFLEGPADVGLLTLRQRRTAPEWLGRVLTVSMSLNVSGLPLGSAIGGSLVSYSVDAALIFAAMASVIAAIATFLLIPRQPNFKAERVYHPTHY